VTISEEGAQPRLELDTHQVTPGPGLETVRAQGADGSWEEDWQLPDLVESDQPCFLLYRLDERDSSGGCFRWILVSWSPEIANTRSFSFTLRASHYFTLI
jgi:hypothetical protein